MTAIDSETKVKRFIYFTSEKPTYVAQNSIDKYCITEDVFGKCHLLSLFDLLRDGKVKLVMDMIEAANKDPLCVKRETLFYILALCARVCQKIEVKVAAYETATKIFKTPDDFFFFIKIMSDMHLNFGHGLKKVVSKYYLSMDLPKLGHFLSDKRSYYGWTHEDVIRLVHLKFETNEQLYLVNKILFKKTKKAKDIEQVNITPQLEALVNKHNIIENLKHCQNETEAAKLIREHKLSPHHVPGHLLSSEMVWDALLLSMDLPALFKEFRRFRRLGFLKKNSLLPKVLEILGDQKKCRACKIHPAHVLIEMKTFERGKPMHPQLKNHLTKQLSSQGLEFPDVSAPVVKNPTLTGTLYKLLHTAFSNLNATGRRIMIVFDTNTLRMRSECSITKSVTTFEATVLTILSILKVEKDVTLATYDGASVKTVTLDKNITFSQAQEQLVLLPSGHITLFGGFKWAMEQKKHIDVFVYLLHSLDSYYRCPKGIRREVKPVNAVKQYRKAMHLPNTKMITVSFGDKSLDVADETPHIFNICGFDHYVPRLIEACCKGVVR